MNPAWKAIDKATCHLHPETRLADPAWARDRDQAHILTQQEFFDGGYFFFPSHEPGSLHRKVRRKGLDVLNWLLREVVSYGCKLPRQISGKDVSCRSGVWQCGRGVGNSRGSFFRFPLDLL